MKGAKDMTRGNPFGLLFGFAFSMMIGNVFQQLYTFVDAMIVGKYLGVTALAALGATEWLVFVMLGCVQGITQGFSISIAKRFGSHDEEELKRDMGGSILLCLVLSVLFTVMGLALCKPILRLLRTPQDMIGMAQIYLRTLYGGVCLFSDRTNWSGRCVLGRNLRVVSGGCVFMPLSVVGISAAGYDAGGYIIEAF